MAGARRVVVTGMGVVTPIGNDVPTFWSAMKEGKSGVGPLRDIDFPEQYVRDLHIQIACQVKDFDPKTRIKNRLLLLTCGYGENVIRWIPPLIVNKGQIDDALKTFAEALSTVTQTVKA